MNNHQDLGFPNDVVVPGEFLRDRLTKRIGLAEELEVDTVGMVSMCLWKSGFDYHVEMD
jgi:hypothetical protein